MAEPADATDGPGHEPCVPTPALEAELERALVDARRQLSLIRVNLASVATFLTRPEQ